MPIANYAGAYLERKADFKVLKSDRKVLAMHIGGFIVECYICAIVAYYYGVRRYEKDKDEGGYKWIVTRNSSRDAIKIPSHYLLGWLNLIETLETNLADRTDILRKIKILQKPIGTKTYVSLRYSDIKDVTDEEYNKWLNALEEVTYWLKDQAEIIVGEVSS